MKNTTNTKKMLVNTKHGPNFIRVPQSLIKLKIMPLQAIIDQNMSYNPLLIKYHNIPITSRMITSKTRVISILLVRNKRRKLQLRNPQEKILIFIITLIILCGILDSKFPYFAPLFQQNQKKITYNALEGLLRISTTHYLIKKYPQYAREWAIAHVYSSGNLRENLKTISNVVAMPSIKHLLNMPQDFSNLIPKNVTLYPQITMELRKLNFYDFPKYDEALALATPNRVLMFPLVFLSDAMRDAFNISSLIKNHNTRNVNWDALYVVIEKIPAPTGPIYKILDFVPMDIKNTTANMGPIDNIYRYSDSELQEKFTKFQVTLYNKIATTMSKLDGDEYKKLEYLLLKILKEENLEQAVDEWNKLYPEYRNTILEYKLPYNILSYINYADVEEMLPDQFKTYNNTFEFLTKSPKITELIAAAHRKLNNNENLSLEEIMHLENTTMLAKNGIIIKNNQGPEIREIAEIITDKLLEDGSNF